MTETLVSMCRVERKSVETYLEVISREEPSEDFSNFPCPCSFLPEEALKTRGMTVQLGIKAVPQVDVGDPVKFCADLQKYLKTTMTLSHSILYRPTYTSVYSVSFLKRKNLKRKMIH